MKRIKYFIFLICSTMTFSCCEKGAKSNPGIDIHERYQNHKFHNLNIGDTFNIYIYSYGINSLYTQDCFGCTHITSDSYRAVSKGKDTLIYVTETVEGEPVSKPDTFFITLK